MKRNFAIISIIILVYVVSGNGQSNSWNGLIPLRSTRIDVEKLLGQPTDKFYGNSFDYKTEKLFVRANYSERQCDSGWDIPKDTLISMTVYDGNNSKSFDELKLDRSKFSKSVDDAFYGSWRNSEEGLIYYFSNVESELQSITYIPKKSDNQNFRCDGFPPFAPEGSHMRFDYTNFYSTKKTRKANLYELGARFDNLMINFGQDFYKNKYKAYVMVYFDNKMPFVKYERFLTEVKNWNYNLRKYSPEQLIFIEGGLREESLIEFYLLPNEYVPPTPNPTLPSSQFMKKTKK